MDDLDAEKLWPLFEQLAKSIGEVGKDAYFEVVHSSDGVPCVHANAAGFLTVGFRLMRTGFKATGIPDDKPLVLKLQNFSLERGRSDVIKEQ